MNPNQLKKVQILSSTDSPVKSSGISANKISNGSGLKSSVKLKKLQKKKKFEKLMDQKKSKLSVGLKKGQSTSVNPADEIDNKFLMPDNVLMDGNLMNQSGVPTDNNMFPTPLQYNQYLQPHNMWGPNH